MKYLGEKSLSSVLSRILYILWYVVLVLGVGAILFFYLMPLDGPIVLKLADIFNWNQNDPDWLDFASYSLIEKCVILPYFVLIIVLFLKIIKNAQHLFMNFKKDVVFDKINVLILSKISKLVIVYSIVTFDLSTLMISLLLFILCEIFNNGIALQEEQDLTI